MIEYCFSYLSLSDLSERYHRHVSFSRDGRGTCLQQENYDYYALSQHHPSWEDAC
jgi:hypothetical protein